MGGRASFGTSSKLKARTLSSAHFCLRNQSTELSTDRDFPHFHSHSQRERSKEKATTTTIDIYYLLGATRIIQGAPLECGSLLRDLATTDCTLKKSPEIGEAQSSNKRNSRPRARARPRPRGRGRGRYRLFGLRTVSSVPLENSERRLDRSLSTKPIDWTAKKRLE